MRDDLDEDIQLARQVAAGDEGALESFYERYADMLYAFIYHQFENPVRDEAQDLWQETLLVAIRTMGCYQGNSRLFTWLCAIARHKVADHFRRQGCPVALASENWSEETDLIDRSPLPEDCVQQRATRLRVLDALGTLPEPYRRALIARYADEKEVNEVARLLGKTYKATESLLSRARTAFKTAFQERE